TYPDLLLWVPGGLTGAVSFPLIDNWSKVPLIGDYESQVGIPQPDGTTVPNGSHGSLLGGYQFGNVVDPSGPAHADPAFVNPGIPGDASEPSDAFAFQGTTPYIVDGQPVLDNYGRPEYLMPWSNTDFTWAPLQPLTNFFNSLMADPSTNPIELPGLLDLPRAIQGILAGLVIDFDPLVPGSPFCPGACSLPGFLGLTPPGIAQTISNIWPGNTELEAWLADWKTWGTDGQTVNWATPDQVGNLANLFATFFQITDLTNPKYNTSDPTLPTGPLPVVAGPCGDVNDGNSCDFGQPTPSLQADDPGTDQLAATGTFTLSDLFNEQWWADQLGDLASRAFYADMDLLDVATLGAM
ncbi:MAG: hypothetical protein ACRDTN_06835, partial [Mycobacterium sp.]